MTVFDNGKPMEKQPIIGKSKITNIGASAAKNIAFSWSNSNIDIFAKKINQSKYLRLNNLNSNMIRLKFNDLTYESGNADISYKYLLPIYDETEKIYISFPVYYKHMIAMYVAASLEVDGNDNIFMDEEFPPMKGKITYSDVQGEQYSKEIEFIVSPIFAEYSQKGEFKMHFVLSQVK